MTEEFLNQMKMATNNAKTAYEEKESAYIARYKNYEVKYQEESTNIKNLVIELIRSFDIETLEIDWEKVNKNTVINVLGDFKEIDILGINSLKELATIVVEYQTKVRFFFTKTGPRYKNAPEFIEKRSYTDVSIINDILNEEGIYIKLDDGDDWAFLYITFDISMIKKIHDELFNESKQKGSI